MYLERVMQKCHVFQISGGFAVKTGGKTKT